MSNCTGYFSTGSVPVSAPTMSMQSAGHAVAQQKQATHRGAPFSRCIRRCSPLYFGGSGLHSSGHWYVAPTLLFLMLTMFLTKWVIVIPRPRKTSAR